MLRLGRVLFSQPPATFSRQLGGAEADRQAQSEKRGDLSLTSWINGGRGYLVIGRLPEQQIVDLARTFEMRFSKS
jgi:anti-sigma factor RsiW